MGEIVSRNLWMFSRLGKRLSAAQKKTPSPPKEISALINELSKSDNIIYYGTYPMCPAENRQLLVVERSTFRGVVVVTFRRECTRGEIVHKKRITWRANAKTRFPRKFEISRSLSIFRRYGAFGIPPKAHRLGKLPPRWIVL